jgi:enoyl-CoA hydratase
LFLEFFSDKEIATIIISNKNKKNSLTRDFFIEFIDALTKVESNEKIKVLVLKGDGDNFSSGVNLNELIQFPSTIDAKDFAILMEKSMNKLFKLNKPTISVVDGFALGAGAGLILNTDISIFTENVKLGFPAVRIGAILPSACTKRLVATVGMRSAKDLLLTGKIIDSNESLRLNIASYVVKKDEVENTVKKIIKQIIKGSSIALELTKETINSYADTENNLYSGDNFAYLYSTADWHQRIWNFLNKE